MKLNLQLILIFLIVSLLPISVISVVYLNNAQKGLKQSLEQNVLTTAVEKAAFISYMVGDMIGETRSLARQKRVIEAAILANRRYANRTEIEIQDEIETIDNAWITSKKNSVTAEEVFSSPLSELLRDYKGIEKRIGEIIVTDIRGATIGMTKYLSDFYQADEQWWSQPFESGGEFIDDRGVDLSVDAIVMGVVTPIRKGGEIIGILKISFRVQAIIEAVSQSSVPPGQGNFILLAESHGNILAHTGGIEQLSDRAKEILSTDSGGVVEGEFEGIMTVMAHQPVPVSLYRRVPSPEARQGISGERWEPTTWRLIVEQSQDLAFAPLGDMKMQFIIIAVIVSVIVILLAIALAKTITRPIQLLTAGAARIGAGDLEHPIRIHSSGELGQLAGTFNRMAEQLKASRDRIYEQLAELGAANRELDTFSHAAAHNLRTPLRALNGFSSILMDEYGERLDETGKKHLQRLQENSLEIEQIIDGFLRLTRATQGGIEWRPVDLSTVACAILDDHHAKDPQRQVTWDVAAGLSIIGDPKLLKIALANLLDNAWKFTGGRTEARIAFNTEERDGEVIYRLSDNGVGFDMSYADKLFQPFQRLHGFTEFPGVSVNLAITQRIIARHGGRIWAYAKPGKGATFYFTLPGRERSEEQ